MAVYPGAEFRFELEIDGLYAGRFMEMSGGVAFNESIVKKLPPAPRRKDKI